MASTSTVSTMKKLISTVVSEAPRKTARTRRSRRRRAALPVRVIPVGRAGEACAMDGRDSAAAGWRSALG